MTNLAKDIFQFHEKFGVHDIIDKMSKEQLKKYLQFRVDMIKEEVKELQDAVDAGDVEGIVDALVDIDVFTIGTADAFAVNYNVAWDEVMKANNDKKPGVKAERPNPFGFPDMIKPEGWKEPSHKGNHGILTTVFEK